MARERDDLHPLLQDIVEALPEDAYQVTSGGIWVQTGQPLVAPGRWEGHGCASPTTTT